MIPPPSLSRFLRRTLPVLASLALVSVGAAQTVYYVSAPVASGTNSTVYGITYGGSSWNSSTTIGTASYGARQLAINSSGSLYLASYPDAKIYQYAPDGSGGWTSTAIGTSAATQSVAVDASGRFYVGGTAIYRFAYTTKWTKDTTNLRTGDVTSNSTALAIDASGNIWAADFGNSRIVELAYNSGTDAFSDATVFATGVGQIYGMTFDSAGNLWAASTTTGSILKFTNTDGALSSVTSTFVTGLTSVKGIAFDADGNLYVSGGGTGAGYLYRYDNVDGTLSTTKTIILANQANPITGLVAVGGAAIPEPATYALLAGAGVLALVVLRRRRAR